MTRIRSRLWGRRLRQRAPRFALYLATVRGAYKNVDLTRKETFLPYIIQVAIATCHSFLKDVSEKQSMPLSQEEVVPKV